VAFEFGGKVCVLIVPLHTSPNAVTKGSQWAGETENGFLVSLRMRSSVPLFRPLAKAMLFACAGCERGHRDRWRPAAGRISARGTPRQDGKYYFSSSEDIVAAKL